MAITQIVNIDLLEKLPDGNFKKKNPSTTASQAGLGNLENYGIATKAEAEVGMSNVKYMTPLRVLESITKNGAKYATGSYVGNNTEDRIISVGFTPSFVIIVPRTTLSGTFAERGYIGFLTNTFRGLGVNLAPGTNQFRFVDQTFLVDGGFKVYCITGVDYFNSTSNTFYWIAFE